MVAFDSNKPLASLGLCPLRSMTRHGAIKASSFTNRAYCRMIAADIASLLQVKLSLDDGIVVLDIGFTGNDPNHGEH
jgi:hypothetical protein